MQVQVSTAPEPLKRQPLQVAVLRALSQHVEQKTTLKTQEVLV